MNDLIVVGAGIAGATVAYAAKEAGFKVLVIEMDSICSGGSDAAGAFLSPKISKPSPYKSYLNRALSFSLAFYGKIFPELLHKNGLLKLPLNANDILRLKSYEPYIDIDWQKRENGYFFPDAGIIDPHKVCRTLLQETEVLEKRKVTSILHNGSTWCVSDIKNSSHHAKHLLLATGSETDLISLPYLRRKNIAGYRYDVRFDGQEKITYNIHKDVSISTYLREEHKTIVGATHIKEKIDLENAAKQDLYGLTERASQIIPMPHLKILRSYNGYRNFSFDYFPIAGPLVDEERTRKAFPSLCKGARVPKERYLYHPNLFIHTALGSRGFVFAPYNAALLIDTILHGREIEAPLLPATRFRKWAHKL